MSEEVITCVDCGRPFIWTLSEQRFYRQRGLSAPRRCPECRSRRRYDQAAGTGPSGSQALRDMPPQRAPGSQGSPPQSSGQVSPRPQRQDYSSWWAKPFYRFAALTFGLAIAITLVMAWSARRLDIVWCWLFAISVVTLFTYGYDKVIAGSDQVRVPENVLLALTLAGGAPGALLGMRYFRHKTAKIEFQGKFWLVLGVQIVILILWFGWLRPALQRP